MHIRISTTLLLVFLVVKIIAQLFIIHPVYTLHRDEYLYLDQANHLAWGYASVPPFTSWISFLIKSLGNSELVVKLFPALFGAMTITVVWFLVKEIGGSLKAQVVSAIAMLFSGLMRLDMLYQPNSIDVLCWTTIYFLMVKYFKSERPGYLYLLAITAGLAFLNKYNVCFLLAGLMPALLFTLKRKIFSKKELYFALGLTLLIVLFNILWQIRHDFPVVRHMKELAETQLVNLSRNDFFVSQLMFFLGGVLIWMSGLYGTLFSAEFKAYRWVGLSYVFTILIFILLNGKGYYAIGLYPVLLAFGCVFIERKFTPGWQKWVLPGLAIVNIILFIPFTKAFPIYPPEVIESKKESYRPLGLLRWEDGEDHAIPQDFADMLGWDELADKVMDVYDEMPDSIRKDVLIYCDNYGQAGAINYYGGDRLPDAVSFNADYLTWFPKDLHFKHIIAIKEAGDTIDPAVRDRFEVVTLMSKVENPFAREFGTQIFVSYGADSTVDELISNEIRKRSVQQED